MDENVREKERVFLIKKNVEKLKDISITKLYITEKELKKHFTDNEILEMINQKILEDSSLS